MSDGGAQHWSQLFWNAGGAAPYAAAECYLYVPGGTTNKTAWSDEAKTTPVAQPLLADANGLAEFYGDGDYRIRVYASGDGPGGSDIYDFASVHLTSDKATMWENNNLTSAPAAAAANLFQLIAIKDGSGNFTDLQINHNTATPAFVSVFNQFFANSALTNIKLKGPYADITAFGAATANSASDNQTAIQAAVDYAEANNLAVYTPPLGAFVTDEITVDTDNMLFFGSGWNSIWKMDPAANSGDQILSAVNTRQILVQNMAFDGNNIGSNTHLIEFTKTSGTFMNVFLDGVRFTNHQGDSALKIGGSGATFSPVGVSRCLFDNLATALHMDTCKPTIIGNNFYNINKTSTSKPIFLDTCTTGVVLGNTALVWGADVAGLHMTDCSTIAAGFNNLTGTEAYGILTDGSSDNNIITNNPVTGPHTTSPVTFAGSSSVVHSNLGSSAFQNGQIITSGVTNEETYNYKLYESQTTDGSGTGTGQLNDDTVTFNDITAVDNPTSGAWDVARFPDLAKYQWVCFAIRNIILIDELQLGSSDQMDTTITTPNEEGYDIYPNVFDPGFFESTPFGSTDMGGGVGPHTGTISDVVSEKEFLKLVIRENPDNLSTSTNSDIFLDDWKDIVSGDAFKIADAVDFTALSDGANIATIILWTDDAQDDLTVKLTVIGGTSGWIIADLYRMKRNVDE